MTNYTVSDYPTESNNNTINTSFDKKSSMQNNGCKMVLTATYYPITEEFNDYKDKMRGEHTDEMIKFHNKVLPKELKQTGIADLLEISIVEPDLYQIEMKCYDEKDVKNNNIDEDDISKLAVFHMSKENTLKLIHNHIFQKSKIYFQKPNATACIRINLEIILHNNMIDDLWYPFLSKEEYYNKSSSVRDMVHNYIDLLPYMIDHYNKE